MNNSNKDANLKEKLKLALNSTVKVISDDFETNYKIKKNKSSEKFDFFELDNLSTKSDFIKARANSDSIALKKKFSNNNIYQRNLPSKFSCKALYLIAEKIRYESLGGKMLKGIEKNFKDNYDQIINLKRKDQLKSKDDVPISEAFELYMIKKFHNIELNSLTKKMLNFWKKDFDNSISKHLNFLKENLENQENYSFKFSEILQKMDILQTEDNEETKKENQEDKQENSSDDNEDDENKKDKNKEDETEASLDTDYDINEYKLDEQLVDTDSEKQNNEEVVQKEVEGKLYYIKYFINKNDFITIATTRPETIFADSAIAVNPKDKKYKKLINKYAKIPIIDKQIKIIADYYADPNQGSGAVKITPAHDFNDYEVGLRHKLEKINILEADGKLNKNCPQKYQGLDRFDARKLIIEDLKSINALEKEETIKHNVPYGDRSNSIIEPYLTEQWFLNVKKMSVEALKAVKNIS